MTSSVKTKWIICILTTIWVFSTDAIFAQFRNANFNNITPADGLPSTSIYSITQDAFGFVWIGTWEYTYRYDGVSFKEIPGSEGGRFVTGDNKGGVWISFSSDVGYYDPNTERVTNYEIPNAVRFAVIVVDGVNSVWGTSSDGIVKFDTVAKRFIKDPGQRSGRVRDLRTPRGNGELLFLWEGNDSQLLGRRNSKGIYTYEDLPIDMNNPNEKGSRYGSNNFGFGVHLMDSTGILITNSFGWAYKKWNETVWTYRKPLHDELQKRPSDLKLDNLGNMWFTQFNSLYKMNIETKQTTVYTHDPSNPRSVLPMNSNRYLYFDRQGVLWITHFGYGISRLNLFDNNFGLLKNSTGIPVLDVISALELKDGSFWIGSRNSEDLTKGLIHYDANGNIINYYGATSHNSPPGKTVRTELSNPYAQSLTVTSDGSIWVGTGSIGPQLGGLNRIRPGNNQITRFKNDPRNTSTLMGDFVSELVVDGSDRVWAFIESPYDSGISVIDPVDEKIIPNFKIQPVHRTYHPELVTTQGDVIVRTHAFKHFIIDHKTLAVKPFADNVAESDSMIFFHQDEKNRLWFSALKGFGYLNSALTEKERFFKFEKLKIEDDFGRYSFCFDNQGFLWLGVGNGLIQFNLSTESVKKFGFERGLQSSVFRNVYKGPSGKLYFMGTGGVNIFDPENIRTNPYPPQMVFTDLRLDEKSIAYGENSAIQKPIFLADKITVAPDVNVVSIDFAAMHFASNKDNQYQYKLAGFDKDWRDGGAIGNATYTNLPPGTYTLFIKSSNLDNVWSDGNKSIAIIILPPWWRTWWAYTAYGFIFLFLIRKVHLYQQKLTIRKERERAQQKELEQAKEIEKAYTELKSTQAQLIQSEKMASLGELTAGIAHEIQNPLNFVNNFSEVNTELIDELKKELAVGNRQLAEEIADDIKQNEEKINHHGKRADAIVKGMLQHSRTSSGQKKLTDINALCDEYLRLSYHGLRAKDKSFNAKFETDFDSTLPKLNVVPQDIGRVVLNLINNAFYATNEKRTINNDSYEPTVTVTTKKSGDKIEIRVKDNGNGIPDSIKEKIFQPFFTTKPTGQGTGLGLSLSYDILKAHGGELKVETREGEGSTFIIQLLV